MSVNMFLPNANEQYTTTKSRCEDISRNFETLKKSILSFANETELKGKAYDSAKQYFNNTYIPLINGFILLSNAIISANNQFIEDYKSQVDVNSLQSDILENQIQRLEIIISELERISAYNSTINFSCEHMLYCYRLQQKKIKEKLEKLLSYNGSSVKLFVEVEDLLNNVKKGISEISNGSSWDTSNNVFILNNSNSEWASNLNKKFEEKELDLIVSKIPNLTENDLNNLNDYLNKNPNYQLPKKLIDYLTKTLDISSSMLKDTGIGLAIMKLGGKINISGGIKGPVGNNSFVLPNVKNNEISRPIIKFGGNAKGIGNGLGYGLTALGFFIGIADDINIENKTAGQAFSHNTASTAIQLTGGAIGGAIATLIFGSNPVGLAAIGTVGLGLAATQLASSTFNSFYNNNWLGTKSLLDYIGNKIDNLID